MSSQNQSSRLERTWNEESISGEELNLSLGLLSGGDDSRNSFIGVFDDEQALQETQQSHSDTSKDVNPSRDGLQKNMGNPLTPLVSVATSSIGSGGGGAGVIKRARNQQLARASSVGEIGGPPSQQKKPVLHQRSSSIFEARKPASSLAPDYAKNASSHRDTSQWNDSDQLAYTTSSSPSLIKGNPQSAKMEIASMDSDSLLHNACKLYPETISVVESALQLDPSAIRRRIPLVCANLVGTGDSMQIDPKGTRQKYCYPINIALRYQASPEIIKLLVSAAPDVLGMRDGPREANSLSIALAQNSKSETITLILSANPICATLADRYGNFPLHAAVRSQHVTVELVTKLYDAHPEALSSRNFHRETPLDIAIRSPMCPEPLLNYLQRLSFGRKEAEAQHLDDSDGSLSLI